ncbi:MAG TPA: hypothetical protein VLH79_06545 [Chthonomonadales bacterium]|nr:hypothetical protein [Chthonomonadales bacterium]
MDKDHRTTSIVIGIIAAAAGIAMMAYAWRWRLAERAIDPTLRSVSEILDDCYAKVKQLQQSVSHLPGPPAGAKD